MPLIQGLRSLLDNVFSPGRRLPDSLEEFRVLHIGGYWRGPNDMVQHMMLGLRAAGVHVIEYDTGKHREALVTAGRPYDHGIQGPVWIREECIREHLDNVKPHIIVCNAGGLSFYPEVAKQLRKKYYLLGIALSDPDVFASTTSRIAPNFDLFLTNDKSLIPDYRKLGANTSTLPLGTNEKFFRPLQPLEKYKTDVLIIGRAHPNRVEPVREIVKRFDTMIYGEGWEQYGISSHGTIYGDDTLHALNSAKIVPIFLANPDGSTMFVKIAILDFPAAGALVITNHTSDVEHYLSYGKEIIGFTSTPDLIAKIEYFLLHPEEADAVRKAGYLKVIREHTWRHIWPKILSGLDGS